MPVSPDLASEMIDRFEQAVIDYERATSAYVNGARREQAEARKVLFDTLTKGDPDA